MAVTNNLKSKVDLPVWEWLRPLPGATTALACTCHDAAKRYIYYNLSNAFYRYDTMTDSWNQLASLPAAPVTIVSMDYSTSHGHYGRAISSGGGLNTIEMGGMTGNTLVGKVIKIIDGKGIGQERTITAVAQPVIKDRGVVTTGSTAAIIDASVNVLAKQWKVNQWRDHQVRVIFGQTSGSAVRQILYNNYNTLTFYDVTQAALTPWWGGILPLTTLATAGAQTQYQIESNIVTVDSNWDVTPDSTSRFKVESDGIWLVTSLAAAPFYTIYYYDVIADVWYQKTGNTGITAAALPGDVSCHVVTDSITPILSGSVTSSTSSSITDSSLTLSPASLTNYELRFTSGVSKGQFRTITSNTSATIIPVRNWDVTPAPGDTFDIHPDTNKVFIIGGNQSFIAQYDDESDLSLCGRRFDYGVARAATVTLSSFEPVSISTIVRTTGGISVLNATPTVAGSGYLVDQILTITTGGTGGTARITSVNATGGVTGVVLETSGINYTAGSGRATTVVPAGGTGCTLDITTIADIATVTTSIPHNFEIGESVDIVGTVQPEYSGLKTIISQGTVAPTTATTFAYVVTGSPATPATYTLAQTATVLVDVAKNWVVNEHVGKLVVVTTLASPNATGVIRRILSNTSNTLTVATLGAAATNSTSRYAIQHDKVFGTDETLGSAISSSLGGRGRSGIATGGSTTTLVDSTKTWPTNYWSNTFPIGASNTGRKVRIVKGTGAGTEMVITSNTATTLTFATQTFSPDSTSVYVILDGFGAITTGGTTTFVDNTQNWGTNIWSGKRVRITGGTGAGSESTISSNTQTQLTIAPAITTDATSTYAILGQNTRLAGTEMFYISNSTDASLNNKYIYMFRGGATNEINRYNITTEEVETVMYYPFSETLTTGSMYAYDGVDRIYFTKDATGRVMYYDIAKNVVENSSTIPYGMSTAITGNRMEITETEDGLKYLYVARHSAQEWWRTLLFW